MKNKIDRILGFLQKLGKALMTPMAVLPAAALMLRLGQPDIWGSSLFGGNGILWMAAAGEAVMDNMNLLFAIGIAIGFADDNNGISGLAGAVGYFIFTNVSHAFAGQIYQGIAEGGIFDMGILAGITAGVVSGVLYNKYKEVRLPQFLGFFGGKRFIPIITAITMVILGLLFGVVWPRIQGYITFFGNMMASSGVIGAFAFGFLNRLLIPVGLHHVLNSFFWFQFGEFTTSSGITVTGDVFRFLNGDKTAGMFQAGFFPIMMFALPAACIAMIVAADKEKRKNVSFMLLGIAVTSLLTGITEPIEFSFLFIAPGLYLIHSLLTGISLALTSYLGMRHGYSFSAGVIDYLLNFNLAEKPIGLLGVGMAFGVVYFIIFYFSIIRFNLRTPGREKNDNKSIVDYRIDKENDIRCRISDKEEVKPLRSKFDVMAEDIVNAVGGNDNIEYVDSCITRIRLRLKDGTKVDKIRLKELGALEIIKLGQNNIQIIIGTMADAVVNRIRRRLRNK